MQSRIAVLAENQQLFQHHQDFLMAHHFQLSTTYYATCPRLTGAISTLETTGMMAEMQERLGTDKELADAYQSAHEQYQAARNELGMDVPEVKGITAGGMPDRVKCLHSLVAHSLSAGPGVNPLGDEALAALPKWWLSDPCIASNEETK